MTPTPQEYSSTQQKNSTAPASDGERVVISGMSGLYPASESVKELSDILYNKVNPVTKAGVRFKYNHPEVPHHAGSVPGLSKFDAQFFKVHHGVSIVMDPMARKLLEQSYQAIYDAGINPELLSGKKIGVYIGSCFSETEKAYFYGTTSRTGLGIVGCSKTMYANRVSYWLNVKGPSMSIDAACCSSTAALEQAYLDISRGECEAAIVGSAYVCLHPQSSVHYGRIMKLSRDGKTKSFDENADGCAKSEAINVLFLQKAKDALRIYADVLHVKSEFTCMLPGKTGPKYGFYRDVDKTINFIKSFYKEASVPAQAIEYVEAFGCAVTDADKVELQALEQVFCNERNNPLLVGSVMSNIGYNDSASGISAITKVLLGYHTGQLAANLHCSSPRQDVAALREGRMRIVTEHERFHRTYVAVNGMSITGINSHVLLHGHYKPKDVNRYTSSIPYLVTISARQDSAVTHVLDNLKSNPIDPEQLRLLHNIHQTAIPGHLGRGFIILNTNEDQKTVSLCERAEYFDDARRPLWFVYSGMGSQWAGMGTQLMRIPIFAAAIERCRQVLEPRGLDIVDIITSPDETFDNILHSFVGIAAIQIGLTDVLQELGLVPDGIIGHSVGELGCAYADGCLTAEEMILSAYSRGLVSLQTPFIRGSMAAIGLGYQQISKMCPPEIEVACHNGPESSTISGPADVMREFVAELTAKGIFAKEVPCSNIAYHSRYIADAGPQLLKYLSEVIKTPKPRSERWLSTSVPQDKWCDPSAKLCSAEYHTNNLLNPVLFEETSRLVPNNAVLVEVAPHGLLQAILKRSLPSDCKNIALTRRNHPDNAFLLLEGIGTLFMEGYNTKVHVLYPKVELPVSTGTPFLSHLVKWAHGENWPLALYNSALRKTSSNCNYTISVHDSETSYLQGHTIRGHKLYPFAASLVLAWDTLAMVMGVPKKQLSVVFSDLQLYSQPILHDQRQLTLSVALHRGTGRFEILNESSKVTTGCITVMSKETQEGLKCTYTEAELNLNAEDIYHLLRDKDYSYSGEFRSISCTNQLMNEAKLLWNNNWVTFIDGLLQLNALRQPLTSFSLPTHIRRICIDIQEHERVIRSSTAVDDQVLIKAKIFENFDMTRCGGVAINNIVWDNLLLLNDNTKTLKDLRFIPYFKSNSDMSSSLEVYLQIVTENVNKTTINVVGIVNQPAKKSVFFKINDTVRNLFGVDVTYKQVNQESVLTNPNNFTGAADLVLVQNLSTDDSLCQFLHRVLRRDQFVVSEEDLGFGHHTRPSSLYRVLSSHTIVDHDNSQQRELQLLRWGPSEASATTAITVRTHSDIALLTSARTNLSPQHRLLVLAPYPPPRGLKELINGWRREANRNKIHLIMATTDSINNYAIDEIPNIDLAFNVFENDTWGGEYYIPVGDCASVSKNITLESKQIGDYDSLTWVEAPDNAGPGVTVTVHYAGISNRDTKTADGSIAFKNNVTKYGMDFSGITDSGERVMGLVECGAASSVVSARPELLWPVPAHWSLEDAATVPLAYAHAFYCLVIKRNLQPNISVMVHGGAGALGQATIALALAHGCQVYTTVSDVRKKQFLLKLFPELRADNIANSRDSSFKDLILYNTKGNGCDIVINSLKGDLKDTSIHCVGPQGICLDISETYNQDEYFKYGMSHLFKERIYAIVDFSNIFQNTNDLKILNKLMSEGISRGYVRPLSRVTYAPHDAARAFRLLAASNHRGKVLLRMEDTLKQAQLRLTCNADRSHLLLGNNETFGLQLADRLVERGAKKLCIHYKGQSMTRLQMKIRSWQKSDVEVIVVSNDLREESDVTAMIINVMNLGPLEGIYVTIGDNQQDTQEALLTNLDSISRKLCPDIKYFAVLNNIANAFGKELCMSRVRSQLPATMVTLPELSLESSTEVEWCRAAVDLTEKALRGGHTVARAYITPPQKQTLLQKIIELADITIPETTNNSITLKDLGMGSDKIPPIRNLLRVQYNLAFEEEVIALLTVDKMQQLENTLVESDFEDVKSLSTFFTYVDSDELLATTDMVFLPTLVNSGLMRDDEFDTSETYLCIVPGMEGHYEKFRVLCERLKLPALVLQPGLDRPHETVQEAAERYTEAFLKKTGLKTSFYLLAYESGVSIALEMAAILEDRGLTGTLYCIGHEPEELKMLLEQFLSKYGTDEQLQDAVAKHMFELMTRGDTTVTLENALRTASTWPQKVDTCLRALKGRVPYSSQYSRALIETALARIERARRYVPRVRALRSQLVLLRAATTHATSVAPLALQRHSQRPVAVHQLRAPLAHATRDLQCAAIINAYLEPEIQEKFDKRNICDTYLLNASSFMIIEADKIM